jgi:hypothetical protein
MITRQEIEDAAQAVESERKLLRLLCLLEIERRESFDELKADLYPMLQKLSRFFSEAS